MPEKSAYRGAMVNDFNNILVLIVFAVCLITAIVGYLLAWRCKRTRYRKAGSLVTAAVLGFAGLVMSANLMGAVTPFPPPDGSSAWGPVVGFLAFSPLPLGAFYMSPKLVWRAVKPRQRCNSLISPLTGNWLLRG